MSKLKIKQGFTLIELLAVIVILAVIALIAVPVVMNIIDKVQKKAFMNTAYGMIEAGELHYAKKSMLDEELVEEIFEFPNGADKLKIKGQLPKEGSMIIDEDGNIAMAIVNGKYCITKDYDDEDIRLLENTSRCAIPYTLAAVATTSEELGVTKVDECIKRGTLCDFGPGVEEPTAFAIEVNDTDIYKFYVINDDGKEVTLLMNKNLADLETGKTGVSWISKEDYNDDANYGGHGNTNKGPLTLLTALKQRTSNWLNIPLFSYTLVNDDDGQGGNYTYPDITSELTTDVRARLIRLEELTKLNCTTNSCPLWLVDNLEPANHRSGYWTSTVEGSITAWYIVFPNLAYNGYFVRIGYYGIRPVITLSK